jgi:hypothetical protein
MQRLSAKTPGPCDREAGRQEFEHVSRRLTNSSNAPLPDEQDGAPIVFRLAGIGLNECERVLNECCWPVVLNRPLYSRLFALGIHGAGLNGRGAFDAVQVADVIFRPGARFDFSSEVGTARGSVAGIIIPVRDECGDLLDLAAWNPNDGALALTNAPLEEDIPLEKDSQTAPAARESATDVFDEFWQAFPSRDGDNPEQPALAAFRKAVAAGADPKAIILGAKAYASATAGRERRYVASAVRWLSEGRWRGGSQSTTNPNLGASISTPTPAPGVWISATSAEWRAWADRWRETKGKSPPVDAKGGWRFPSQYPPAPLEQAA